MSSTSRSCSCSLTARVRLASSPLSISAHSCTARCSSTCRGSPALAPSSVGENQGLKIFSQITCGETEREKHDSYRPQREKHGYGWGKRPLAPSWSRFIVSGAIISHIRYACRLKAMVSLTQRPERYKALIVLNGRPYNGKVEVTKGCVKWSGTERWALSQPPVARSWTWFHATSSSVSLFSLRELALTAGVDYERTATNRWKTLRDCGKVSNGEIKPAYTCNGGGIQKNSIYCLLLVVTSSQIIFL